MMDRLVDEGSDECVETADAMCVGPIVGLWIGVVLISTCLHNRALIELGYSEWVQSIESHHFSLKFFVFCLRAWSPRCRRPSTICQVFNLASHE